MIERLAGVARQRPAAAMSAATAASRATGFLRTLALAWALGVSGLGDAYNIANTAPNMLFQLAAGGILTSALVPVLTQSADGEERRDAAAVLFGAVLAVGAVASVALAVAAPLVLDVLTSGAGRRGDRADVVDVGTTWLRWFAPQVLAYAVSVYAVGILTARRRLFLGAAAPVLTNLLTIGGVVAFVAGSGRRPAFAAVDPTSVRWLGAATTAGVVAMAATQLAGAWRVEPGGLWPRWSVRHPAIRRLGGIAPWVALYVTANQVGLAAVVAFASSVPGGVSAYQWAFAVMQLPHALIGVSIVTAAFPRISEAAVGDVVEVSAVVNETLRRLVQLVAPAAMALAALAPLVAVAIVGRGGATLVAAGITGFAVSLVPFSVFQLLTRTSYALRDGKSPALVNLAVNAANIAAAAAVLALADAPSLRVAGLAVSHAISYVVGAVLLNRRLRRHHATKVDVAPRAAAAVVAGVVVAIGIGQVVARAVPASQLVAGGLAMCAVAAGAAALVVARRRTA